jgi:hypothetical protein
MSLGFEHRRNAFSCRVGGFCVGCAYSCEGSLFTSLELTVSNSVTIAGRLISNTLTVEQPSFQNVKLNWIYPHLFMLEARQRVGIGYRDCLIVGTQVREDEVRIQFKVFEYEHPPDVKLLGGFLQLSTDIKITSQDPKVAAANAEKFQSRIKDGVRIITERIGRSVRE